MREKRAETNRTQHLDQFETRQTNETRYQSDEGHREAIGEDGVEVERKD